jgi:hypothetical protein
LWEIVFTSIGTCICFAYLPAKYFS